MANPGSNYFVYGDRVQIKKNSRVSPDATAVVKDSKVSTGVTKGRQMWVHLVEFEESKDVQWIPQFAFNRKPI